MQVRELMSRDVVTVGVDATVADAADSGDHRRPADG
jgi:CBS domain-containing protein